MNDNTTSRVGPDDKGSVDWRDRLAASEAMPARLEERGSGKKDKKRQPGGKGGKKGPQQPPTSPDRS